MALSSTQAPKRKLGDTDFEIPNSEDEDYGWEEEDSMSNLPSQWQGSEDILLGRHPESDAGEQDAEEENEPKANDTESDSESNQSG